MTSAVLAAYPDATIQRTETDSAGAYDAQSVTADGEQLVVALHEDFAITGTTTGGPGGRGDADCPAGELPSGEAPATPSEGATAFTYTAT